MAPARVRRACGSDAKGFVELFERIAASTPYMAFVPGERTISVDAQAAIFDNQARSLDVHLVATIEEDLAGFISVLRNNRTKSRHIGSVVVGIAPAFQRMGIGGQLCESAELAARDGGLSRLELTVAVDNSQAVRLYQRLGFVVEGVRRASMNVDGVFRDELFMSKLL